MGLTKYEGADADSKITLPVFLKMLTASGLSPSDAMAIAAKMYAYSTGRVSHTMSDAVISSA